MGSVLAQIDGYRAVRSDSSTCHADGIAPATLGDRRTGGPAVVVGAVVNFKLIEELEPAKPYYFGHPDEERDQGGTDIGDIVTAVKERVRDLQDTVEARREAS